MVDVPWPRSMRDVLELPDPDLSLPASAVPDELNQAASFFLMQWHTLSSAYSTILEQTVTFVDPTTKRPGQLSGEDLWCALFHRCAVYHEFFLERILALRDGGDGPFPVALNVNMGKRLTENGPAEGAPTVVATGYEILGRYITSLSGVYFSRLFREVDNHFGPLHTFEAIAHEELNTLAKLACEAPNATLRATASWLVSRHLARLAPTYSRPLHLWTEGHLPGPFSALRLSELQLLAERAATAGARYGYANLARRFEQQLSLLVQSLGFIVIRTRTGERTVDRCV